MNTHLIPRLLAAAVAAASGIAQERTPAPVTTIAFDSKTGALSLRAKGQPLSTLLRALQEQHGVRVTVVGLQDKKIDVDFSALPLPDALAALLGDQAAYLLDLGALEIDLPAPRATGAQRSHVAEMAAGRRMEEGSPVRSDLPVRPEAGMAQRPATTANGRFMAPMESIPGVITDEDRDQGPTQETIEGRHACLVLQVHKDRTIRVDRIVEQPGNAVQATSVTGEWLYEVLLDDQVIAVGSLQNPLELSPICSSRPADPRRRFRMGGLDSARIVLLLDERLLDPAARARTTIRFHELCDGADLPSELTPATIASFRAKSVGLTTVGAPALLQAHLERK